MSLGGIIPQIRRQTLGTALRRLQTNRRLSLAAQCALLGFVVAGVLFIDTALSIALGSSPRPLLFLLLCPPSLASMPLGHSEWRSEPLTWLFIALQNAALYAMVGLIFGTAAESEPHRRPGPGNASPKLLEPLLIDGDQGLNVSSVD
jgi:hypothetical protein